jgi:hypothetical protein
MERAGISGEVAKKISGHKTDDSAYRRYDIVDNWDIENAGKKPEEFLKVRLERSAKRPRLPTRRSRNLPLLPNPKRLRRHIPRNLSSITPRIALKAIYATSIESIY